VKKYIRETYKPPALENDGAELNFMYETDRYYLSQRVYHCSRIISKSYRKNLSRGITIREPIFGDRMSFNGKNESSKIDDGKEMDIVWCIVTDAEKWFFMERI
ncbi:1852_t:CDS:2, partial [Paraglomus occultum]